MAGPLGFSITETGDEAAAKVVAGLATRGEDPRPAFKQVLVELAGVESPWFSSSGRDTWASLSDYTRQAKAAAGYPDKPLIRTGALERSLTVKRGSSGVRSATKRQMKFGTKVPYARFHKYGKRIPRRDPLIPLDTRTRRRMVTDVRDYLLGKRSTLSLFGAGE